MWLALAFLSAALLGLYDTAKKASLKDNAVIPVLFLNTVFSTLIFSPFIIQSIAGDSSASIGAADALRAHLLTFAKSCIVLSSWLFGYFGLKHLPITIVGPINATRPILVLLGAMLFFRREAERMAVGRSYPCDVLPAYAESFEQKGKCRFCP